MQAPPPVSVELRDFRLWRLAMGVLGGLTAGGLLLWACTWHQALGWGLIAWVDGALALGLAAVFATVRHLTALEPMRLRWDGECWHWMASAQWQGPGSETGQGSVQSRLDFDAWMLLRLQPLPGAGRVVYVPASRASLPQQWHALRCAVFAAP
jgi:hypothetical protein